MRERSERNRKLREVIEMCEIKLEEWQGNMRWMSTRKDER